ncbi:MAG: leucine-rich repeat domain-containing protein [Gemmatimonadota bacterium]|nr:leucine-rich repeat domain-containing protein [Gemmatimonadota bacterium]
MAQSVYPLDAIPEYVEDLSSHSRLLLDTQIENPPRNNSALELPERQAGETIQFQLFVPGAAERQIQGYTVELALRGKTFDSYIDNVSGVDWNSNALLSRVSATGNPTLSMLSLSAVSIPAGGYLGQVNLRVSRALTSSDVFAVQSASTAGAGGVLNLDVTQAVLTFRQAPACPGDFNGDGMVNLADFLAFAGGFGARSGDANYEFGLDLDGSGAIDLSDFLAFAGMFGTTCPVPPPPPVNIPDANLRAVIEESLGKASGTTITRAEMETLTRIEASNRGIRDLTGLEYAINLEYLSLRTTYFSKMSALSNLSALSKLIKLRRLELLGMQIELPADVFSGLHNLNSLSLAYTQIEKLPRDVFAGLGNLQSLSLYSNENLTSLPDGVFDGLTNLRRLSLDNNGLTGLPAGVFADLSGLEELWLRSNPLAELPDGVFSGLVNLETLWLKSNQLSSLPPGAFAGLTRLTKLSLGNNQLRELPAGLFVGVTNLSSLSLAGNPGAPFALTLDLERTDSPDRLAPGPAGVAVKVAEGTPFEITAQLVIVNGSTSDSTFTISTGGTVSAVANVMGTGATATYVGWGPVTRVPGGFDGLQIRTGNPINLFAASDKRWPKSEGGIPAHILQVSGPEPELNLRSYFSDADGAVLTYSVASQNAQFVSGRVNGSAITLMPKSKGATSLFVTATDEDGLSALQRVDVTVLGAPDPNSFNVDLVFVTPVTETVRSATRKMAKRWTEVITGDLPDVPLLGDFNDCGWRVQDHRFYGIVDDLVVFVEIAPILGGTGIGGPCGKRDGSFLPTTGRFVLDSEAAGYGDGSAWTIFHELGHVLGIGTIWADLGLIKGIGEEPYFSGPLAIAAFDVAGGVNYAGAKVPVSEDLGHWDGDAFGWGFPRELMMDGGGTVLSAITIQSLADLGYEVDITQAEPFQIAGAGKASEGTSSSLRDDILRGPTSIIDENGRVLRVMDDGKSSDSDY